MAAYLSDLVAVFEAIRLAMTVAESRVSPLFERLSDSTGSSPRNCLIWSGWPSRLRTRAKRRCQRLLTAEERRAAAYLSEVRALFAFRPSPRCFAPSAPMLLSWRLRAQESNHGVSGAIDT